MKLLAFFIALQCRCIFSPLVKLICIQLPKYKKPIIQSELSNYEVTAIIHQTCRLPSIQMNIFKVMELFVKAYYDLRSVYTGRNRGLSQ